MYVLTKQQKLDFILEKVEELKLSAYEISKGTNLTEAGIARIIKKIAKSPHENSLNQILEFLEKKVLGSEIGKKNDLNSREIIYSSEVMEDVRKNPLVRALTENNRLTMEILKLHSLLRENNIPFKNIFEEEKK